MSQRKLPLWLRAHKTADKQTQCPDKLEVPSAAVPESVPTPDKDGEPPKKCLRSNFTFPAEEQKPPNVPIEYLPFIDYTGAIEYYTTLPDIAFRCHLLLEELLQQTQTTEQDIPIAFDLEWPFSFKTGQGRTALMQLCARTDCCVLFQISCLQRLPAALMQLLYHPRVVLHGVNIKNDFRKLARDFPTVNADRLIARCVELGSWYNELNGSTVRWCLARLVEEVLNLRMNKDKGVRMSQWHVLPLSDDQKLYAAIDVYIGQKLYLRLEEMQSELESQQAIDVENQPLTNSNNNPTQGSAKL